MFNKLNPKRASCSLRVTVHQRVKKKSLHVREIHTSVKNLLNNTDKFPFTQERYKDI